MAFFDKLNTVARTAAKTAADMASDAIGTGRIAVKIKREEAGIEAQYEKIGQYIYEMRNQGMEITPEIEECCVAIDIALATIKELREELQELRESEGSEAAEAEADVVIESEACEVDETILAEE